MKKEFQIPSSLSEVQKTSVQVLDFLKPLRLTEGEIFDVRLCLEESLINAIKYGNALNPDVPVHLVVEYTDTELKMTVEDRGEGFDTKRISDCTKEENLLKQSGRGIYLISQLMDKISYNAKGNCLSMVKRLGKKAKA